MSCWKGIDVGLMVTSAETLEGIASQIKELKVIEPLPVRRRNNAG